MNKSKHIKLLRNCYKFHDEWAGVKTLTIMEYYHGWLWNGVFFSKGGETITEYEVFPK